MITFDIFFDKNKIRLVYKTFFYFKKNDTYYSNINLSCEYLEFIRKSIKKIKNVFKKNKEGKEYLDNYYNYRKYSYTKNLCEEIVVRKNSYQNDKFNKVFTRRMSLKEFKEILDKNDEVSIFLPLIDCDNKKIRFHEKVIRKKYIKKMLKNLLHPKDYTEIAFENDLHSLYALFDYFIHAPLNTQIEAFGQTYIEALSAKVPAIFTLSGVANEFIIDKYNAIVVPHCSSKAISTSLLELIKNKDLCSKLVENGLKTVQPFSAQNYIANHINLYNKLCHQKDKN